MLIRAANAQRQRTQEEVDIWDKSIDKIENDESVLRESSFAVCLTPSAGPSEERPLETSTGG